MKKFEKIISILLVFTMVFAFASCKDNKTNYEQGGSTTTTESTTEESTTEESTTESTTEATTESTTKKETTTKKPSTTKKPTTTKKETTTKYTGIYIPLAHLEGTWVAKETIKAKDLYAPEFYNPEITKTDLVINSYYKFNFEVQGTFSIYGKIANESTFRAEYREAAITYYEKNLPEGESLSQEDYNEIDRLIDEDMEYIRGLVTDGFSGTCQASETTITYNVGGEKFTETYVLSDNDNKLTFTGSSLGNEGYPVTYTRVS